MFARYLKLPVYHDSFKQKSGLSPSQAVTVVQQLSDDDELAELVLAFLSVSSVGLGNVSETFLRF